MAQDLSTISKILFKNDLNFKPHFKRISVNEGRIPIPDPPKKMEIISVQSVLFLSKTSEICSVNPL